MSVFLWFERVPNAEDLPLRSATARLAPKHRATAELALSAAMVGAGHCLLALGDPDGAVYAAATAVRSDTSTHLPLNITDQEVRIGRSRRNDVVLLRDPEVSKREKLDSALDNYWNADE